MEPYIIVITMIGFASIGAAIMPRLVANKPLSFPIIYVAIGVIVFLLPLGIGFPDSLEHIALTERLTEFVVIVSLMGAGLKLDRSPSLAGWRSTIRLLVFTMPITIAAAAILGWWAAGLAPATAVLLGAVIAPTDPVLASDVQVGPPGETEEDETRFTLTAEAGLNDGLAFPFIHMAITMAVAGMEPSNWLGDWLLMDVGYKIIVGVIAGVIIGRLLAQAIFGWASEARLSRSADGFVALGASLLTYGITEIVGGYGFLAVFVAAYTLSRYERDHEYHTILHSFPEEIERLFSAALLVAFGGALGGGLLAPLTWQGAAVGVALVLIVRPVAGYIATIGTGVQRRERAAIAFLAYEEPGRSITWRTRFTRKRFQTSVPSGRLSRSLYCSRLSCTA